MFFLTTLNSYRDRSVQPRCVGYFDSLEGAREILEKNLGELDEGGYYNLAVIERIPAGLYPRGEALVWYAYQPSIRTWKECERPEVFQRTVNFGIG